MAVARPRTEMIAVVSQAWTTDPESAAVGYLDAYRSFLEFHRASPGFRGRRLLRGIEDRTHFINVRFFDSVDDYEAMVLRPGYGEHIAALGAFLDLERLPPKEYVELVVEDGP